MPTYACIADARIHSNGGGAGRSLYIPVGYYNVGLTGYYRGLVKFELPNWTALGIKRLTAAQLKLRNSDQNYIARGGTPRIIVRRITTGWSEGSEVSLSTSNAVRWANQPQAPTLEQVDTGTLFVANNAWIVIDVLTLVKRWAPTSVEGGSGYINYGFMLLSFDESSTARTTEFWSRESGSDPQLVLTYETNTAPGAPVVTEPISNSDGTASIAAVSKVLLPGDRISHNAIRVRGTSGDTDPGDYITGLQSQIYGDTATDAVPGSPIIDTTMTDFSGTPTAYSRDLIVDALTIGSSYRGRYRTRDKALVWATAWSSLLASRFMPDTPPGAPTNLSADIGSQTPTLYGSLADPDPGAAIGSVDIEVFQDTPTGQLAKWLSGWTASGGTRFGITYSGPQTLEFGVQVRFRARIRDNIGLEGPWSNWFYWTPRQVIGPDNMTPRTIETKQNSRTPTLTIAHSSAFTAHELEVARNADGSQNLWDVGVTSYASTSSKAITYAGASLDWGRTYWWRSKVFVGGTTWTEWSPWFPFYINAYPNDVVPSIDNAVDPGYNQFSDGPFRVVATQTPTLRGAFSDPDKDKGYTENPTRREVTVGPGIASSPWVITTGITDNFTIPAATLAWDVIYFAWIRYDDTAGLRTAGRPLYFKCSQPPVVTVGTAVDVTDPTPKLDWNYSSPSGKLQRSFRAKITENATGKLIHDSGEVISAASEYIVPGGVLNTGVAYTWTVTVYDTDRLSATLA